MRIVAALGGTALFAPGESQDANIQPNHIVAAVEALAPLVRAHDVVVTHGVGPQVGLSPVESEGGSSHHRPYALDDVGALTQGMIGYWLVQALQDAVPDLSCAALICRTVVRADDPAFSHPSMRVGQAYPREQVEWLAREHGWQIVSEGSGWRRVVASPVPQELVEATAITRLVDAGTCVVCAGGGGVPVVRDEDGGLRGIEAVIDKDRTAALLAELVGAQMLLLLTDVPNVEIGFGTPAARPIHRTSVAALRALTFPAGSMGPKVESACDFTEVTGNACAIGRIEDAEALVSGLAGTIVQR